MDLTTARNRLNSLQRHHPDDTERLDAARADLAHAHIADAIRRHGPLLTPSAVTDLRAMIREVGRHV